MKPREVLIEARRLIEDPERWTQHTLARNPETRRPVDPDSPRAGQWCLWGAVEHVLDARTDYIGVWDALTAVLEPRYPSFASFNDADGRTHTEVLAAFDKAIAECES